MVKKLVLILFFILPHVLAAQIVINEVCSANADLIYDLDYYNFSGWVELYNKGNASVNIGGYYLSDKLDKKDKWRIPTGTSIPAKGYLLIWCDEMNKKLHTNFSLDSDGEHVVLSNSGLAEVDKVSFPEQFINISYGRTEDGGPTWGYLVNPTPQKKNDGKTASQQLSDPTVSLNSGRYGGTQSLTLTHPTPNIKIVYTLDGSEPISTSTLYTKAVSITKTTTLKVRAFLDGFIPSNTIAKTYFINEHAFTLPVVSISTKPAYLWDNQFGIYADGTNGIIANCQTSPKNWNQDWDRHAVFEFFNASGSKEFDQHIDIRIGGACSRGNPQKSFVIKARDKYGSKTIDEKLFSTKENSKYGGFIFRNSGNDFWHTMFRDALMQSLTIGQMDVDYLAYEPSIFYLNGAYWGIQNIREKIDADYIETNYGVDRDDLDLIEANYALEGSIQPYNSYLSTLQSMDLTSPEAFTYIENNIDVTEFINYMTAEIFYANTDWPGNNVKFWRQSSNNGKWRWILWDTDFGFGLYSDQSYATHPTLDFATDPDNTAWPNPAWSTLHLRLLLQNPEFRTRFIQTLTTSLSVTFEPQRVIGFIDAFQNRIKTEIPYHTQRWGQSVNNWNNEVQRLRTFAVQRNAYMYQHIASFFGLDNETVKLSINAYPLNAGGYSLNGIKSTNALSDAEYFKGLPYTVTAVPNAGYQFTKWNIKKRETTFIPLIEQGSMWKYFDQGSLPDVSWMSNSYDDSAWPEGEAELGYGEGDEQTVIGYGGNANAKFITSYFRKTFEVADITDLTTLSAKLKYDDGVVVYLNGTEVFRTNMPQGAINYNTVAIQDAENNVISFSIPEGIIQQGINVVAVEVHQNTAQSSDLSFELELSTVKLGSETEVTSSEITISDLANSDIIMEAVFEPVEAINGIIINEFCADNSLILDEKGESEDWIELYNKSNAPVDLAGLFITDNLNNKTKYQIKPSPQGETIIEPGGYKILWADEELKEGPLHVNFKLSADGESIGLYQMTGTSLRTLDEILYAAHYQDLSYGRIPNVTGPFTLTAKPTPMAENELEIPTSNDDNIQAKIILYPNPTTDELHIDSPYMIEDLTLYNTTGKVVKTHQDIESENKISLKEQPSGLYLLVMKVQGKIVTKRVVKTE